MSDPIPMQRTPGDTMPNHDDPPGTYAVAIMGFPAGECMTMQVVLPHVGLMILPLAPGVAGQPFWTFTGTDDAPTLAPSILSRMGMDGISWHGWVRDGALVSA